jgi:hypothetical protein
MRAFTLLSRTDLDTLWGLGTTLPVATFDGAGRPTAATERARRRALAASGEALTALRALRITGQAHVRTLRVEPTESESLVVDADVEIQVELADGLVLHVQPHRAGGTAAVFFSATSQRCWVIEYDDLPTAATTLLTMTAERLGDTAWAARHGVAATSVRMVPARDGQWQLGLQTDGSYVVAEPNGSVVRAIGRRAGAVVDLPSEQVPSRQTLAQTAADLTRDAASALMAA